MNGKQVERTIHKDCDNILKNYFHSTFLESVQTPQFAFALLIISLQILNTKIMRGDVAGVIELLKIAAALILEVVLKLFPSFIKIPHMFIRTMSSPGLVFFSPSDALKDQSHNPMLLMMLMEVEVQNIRVVTPGLAVRFKIKLKPL